jgi:hypothetical protein
MGLKMENEVFRKKRIQSDAYVKFLDGCLEGLIASIEDCKTIEEAKNISKAFKESLKSLDVFRNDN